MKNETVIVKRNGVSIVGELINGGPKLGNYSVKSGSKRSGPYPLYKDAETEFKRIQQTIIDKEKAKQEIKNPSVPLGAKK